jgi:hypothetical protein
LIAPDAEIAEGVADNAVREFGDRSMFLGYADELIWIDIPEMRVTKAAQRLYGIFSLAGNEGHLGLILNVDILPLDRLVQMFGGKVHFPLPKLGKTGAQQTCFVIFPEDAEIQTLRVSQTAKRIDGLGVERGHDNHLRARRRIGNAFEQFEPTAPRTHEIEGNGSDKRIGEFGFKSCGRSGMHDHEVRFSGASCNVRGDLGIVVEYGDSGPGQHASSPQ